MKGAAGRGPRERCALTREKLDITGVVILAYVSDQSDDTTTEVSWLAVFVHRLPALRLTVSVVLVSVVSLALTTSTAWADAATDRFQALARDQLEKPYLKAPFPCDTFWASSGKDRYVVDMAPWAAASGLRRGDHPVAYAGIPLAGTVDSDQEVWAQVPNREYVDVHVERAGKEVLLRIPCRDNRQKWEAGVSLWRAIAVGRWQDCVDTVSRLVKIAGYAPSGLHYTAILCMLEKAKSEKQRPPDEYWRRLHAWTTKAIE